MKKILVSLAAWGVMTAGALSANGLCEDRLFTISTSTHDGVAVGDLLSQLASECGYSMLIKDRAAQDRLTKNIASVNVRQLPIEKIFDIVLSENELSYEFDGNLLKVSFLVTETFQINYIGTSRVGSSNTDITLTNNIDSTGNGTTTQATTQGTGLGAGAQGAGGAAVDIQSSVNTALANSALRSGGAANSASGTKIMSLDQFDFWGKLEREIFEIAFRPGDAHQPQRIFSTTPEQNQAAAAANQQEGAKEKEFTGKGQSVVVNKIAGLLTVTGTSKQLDRVRKYLKDLDEQLQNQVMIDVNILTVTHSNANTVGVDWNQLFNFANLVAPAYGVPPNEGAASILNIGGGVKIFTSGVDIRNVIKFLNTYGKVRSISNPKVLTLNNQPALISVGSILRYTQTTSYATANTGGNQTTTNTSYPTLFSGVLLDVTPSVQGDYIMLKINPSITTVKDLAVENQATALNTPPNLSANQLSSLVRAKSGDRIVLGGLISKNVTNNINRVPILGYIPLLKYIFSYDSTVEQATEMVIVITPHIIKRSSDNPSLQDLGYSDTVYSVSDSKDVSANLDRQKMQDKQNELE